MSSASSNVPQNIHFVSNTSNTQHPAFYDLVKSEELAPLVKPLDYAARVITQRPGSNPFADIVLFLQILEEKTQETPWTFSEILENLKVEIEFKLTTGGWI